MSDMKLAVPEGYFERSMQRTLAEVSRIKRRRRAALLGIALIVFVSGSVLAVRTAERVREEDNYLALQAEMSRIDIFYEINQ